MLASIGYWIYRKHRENWKDQTILIPPLHCHLCTSINCLSAEPFNKNLHWKNNSGHSINSWVVQYQVNHHTCNWNIQPQRKSYSCYSGVLRKIACCCKINGSQNHWQDYCRQKYMWYQYEKVENAHQSFSLVQCITMKSMIKKVTYQEQERESQRAQHKF